MWAYGHLPNQTILAEAKWLTAFFTLSLVANAVATCMFLATPLRTLLTNIAAALLAFRIWWVDRRLSNAGEVSRSSLTPVVRIVLESGIINAAYLFAYVMTLEFGSEGLEIMSEMVRPIVYNAPSTQTTNPYSAVCPTHGDNLLHRHPPDRAQAPRRYGVRTHLLESVGERGVGYAPEGVCPG